MKHSTNNQLFYLGRSVNIFFYHFFHVWIEKAQRLPKDPLNQLRAYHQRETLSISRSLKPLGFNSLKSKRGGSVSWLVQRKGSRNGRTHSFPLGPSLLMCHGLKQWPSGRLRTPNTYNDLHNTIYFDYWKYLKRLHFHWDREDWFVLITSFL